MKLWTIVPARAWEVLNRHACLRATEHQTDRLDLQAYQWMVCQMVERRGLAGMGSHVPIWAWYQYGGCDHKRPDLRIAGHLPRGAEGYRIEFQIAEDQVLLSDFNTWHHVLNYYYLPSCERDHDDFLSRYGSDADTRYSWDDRPSLHAVDQVIIDSWSRIFDLDWHDPFINVPRCEKQIQACLEELHLDQVVSADRFIAR